MSKLHVEKNYKLIFVYIASFFFNLNKSLFKICIHFFKRFQHLENYNP